MKKTITLSIATLLLGTAIMAQVPRKVLVEDFTGEWCGWCPLGRTAAEHIEAAFPNQVVMMGQHYGDPMACVYSNALSAYDSYGYPGFMIDRNQIFGNLWQGVGYTGSELDAQVSQELSSTSPLGVGITSTYNSSTRLLNVTVTANFAIAQSGIMRISCVLTEDSVSTPNAQHNYMNTSASTPWFGFGDPITTYHQRDVVRKGLSATWGDANSIPTTGVLAGSSYSKSYSYTIPSTWDVTHMHIVGFVSHYATVINSSAADTSNVDVMNAEEARLGETIIGIPEMNSNISALDIFPNPAAGAVMIPFSLKNPAEVSVKIYDFTGRNIRTISNGLMSSGDQLLHWDATNESGDQVANGIYLCEIQSGEFRVTKRIVISK